MITYHKDIFQGEFIIANVKVIAGAKRNDISFLKDEIKIKTNAQRENGKANKQVIEILAKSLDISKSSISIIRGEFFPLKQVKIVISHKEIMLNLSKQKQ